jgi:phosphopantothenoylcysteine decarboxylase/phosphopantothenate--cysteine ligase
MGAALAEAALARGARVTLLAAAIEVPLPEGAEIVRVETARELREALRAALKTEAGADPGAEARADALVMAAAVADFTPTSPKDRKIARADGLTLELSPTPDLLGEVAASNDGAYLVGFAAETGDLDRAPGKLAAKNIDLLVANDVSEAGSGFGTETNRVTLFDRSGSKEELPMLSKREVADRILDRVAAALDDRDAGAQTAATKEPASREGAR